MSAPDPANWSCQIGEVDRAKLPGGSDLPMRQAVARAYKELTGEEPEYVFSGWGFELPERYRAVVEDRLPDDGYDVGATQDFLDHEARGHG